MVLQVTPLLQKVNLLSVVVSQNTSAKPIVATSTDVVATSFTGLPAPTAAGTLVLRSTASQITWTAFELIAAPAAGIVGAGGVMNAVNECMPALAL
jgi:hypothetical protein